CALAAPPVPRRRMVALRAGKPEHDRLTRLLARTDLPAGRRAGGERHAGGAGADQAPVLTMQTCRALVVLLGLTLAASAFAASGKRPAPPGAVKGAPAEYTGFSSDEITRGFMALAFGSDLHLGAPAIGVRRFASPIRA